MSDLHDHLLSIQPVRPEDYQDEGGTVERNWSDCSCGCKWYLILEGRIGMDWGVCCNPKSHRCGLLTFEHQGCRHFEMLKRSNDDLDDELSEIDD